ncbi:MAG: hypothetical protein JO033_08155 [Acidobacteriaceae bacterium]|nr:hypothetical protein [Acidobacteriaceae bacterium]MBV9499104.1 hypothetical protein [Acidobacteriaceae bacterium]
MGTSGPHTHLIKSNICVEKDFSLDEAAEFLQYIVGLKNQKRANAPTWLFALAAAVGGAVGGAVALAVLFGARQLAAGGPGSNPADAKKG